VLLTGAGDAAGTARLNIERIAKPIELQLLINVVSRFARPTR
jgi:hypothetical protein